MRARIRSLIGPITRFPESGSPGNPAGLPVSRLSPPVGARLRGFASPPSDGFAIIRSPARSLRSKGLSTTTPPILSADRFPWIDTPDSAPLLADDHERGSSAGSPCPPGSERPTPLDGTSMAHPAPFTAGHRFRHTATHLRKRQCCTFLDSSDPTWGIGGPRRTEAVASGDGPGCRIQL